jgi:hypothetical protein
MVLEKIWAYIRFSLNMLVSGFFAITAYIVYPISYLLKDKIREYKNNGNKFGRVVSFPLWLYLNDGNSNDIGYEWYHEAVGLYPTNAWNKFRLAYMWSVIRNPAWNHYEVFKPNSGDVEKVSLKGSIESGVPHNWETLASLRYVNKDGEFRDNKGDFLSLKFSRIGKKMVWYRIGNTLHFIYSFANKVGKYWIELQYGSITRRYKIRFKIKDVKIFENKDN